MLYESETRAHFQNSETARKYKAEYAGPIRLSNFRAKIIAHREKFLVRELLANLVPLSQLIDIPCGTGKMADVLAGSANNLVAADISQEMMNHAENDYRDNESFSGFVVADASKTPFTSNQFDCVVMVRLLHRIPLDLKPKFLKEVHRITRQYAVVSYSTSSVVSKLSHRANSDRKINYVISHAHFAEMCTEIGFEIITSKTVLPLLSTEVIALLRISPNDSS